MKWSEYNNLVDVNTWREKKMGEISTIEPEAVAQLRQYSLEVVDEYSKKDPKYSAKAGDLLKKLLKMSGQI